MDDELAHHYIRFTETKLGPTALVIRGKGSRYPESEEVLDTFVLDRLEKVWKSAETGKPHTFPNVKILQRASETACTHCGLDPVPWDADAGVTGCCGTRACDACRKPLTPYYDGQRLHPLCEAD